MLFCRQREHSVAVYYFCCFKSCHSDHVYIGRYSLVSMFSAISYYYRPDFVYNWHLSVGIMDIEDIDCLPIKEFWVEENCHPCSGGFGEVFDAWHTKHARVAVKIYYADGTLEYVVNI